MVVTRILDIKNLNEGNEEIRKIGVDASSIKWLSPKTIHLTMKIEKISCFAANVIKQEMLGKGGDAAVNRGVANFEVENSDILVMGTYSQFKRLIHKLSMQPPSIREIAEEMIRTLHSVETSGPGDFECGKYRLPMGEKTYVMGILNLTPDSFSDGGKYSNIDIAIKKAQEMVNQGVDIIDIGGESTRPGYTPVESFEEINRIVPVIEKLSKVIDVPISVDTSKAIVADKALAAGACMVNDVWGLQKDKDLAKVIANNSAGIVIMHNNLNSEYKDLMGDIVKFLRKSIEIAEAVGIPKESIVVDPGIGFGKTLEQNLEIMKKLREIRTLALPVLIGTSRKSMIGKILDLPVFNRLEGTSATVTLGIANGADIVRVHDVKEMIRVARMTDAMVRN